jgi:hypothetical protein
VNSDPEVFDSADDDEICAGGFTTLHSEVVGGAGGNNYQWQQYSSGSWSNILGANQAEYITEILNEGSYLYRVQVSQDAGCQAVSNGITITVNGDPEVFDSADDTEICEGGNTTLHSEVTGGAGGNTYQWQEFIEGFWVDIFGADQADYITDALSSGSYTYRVVVVQDAGCQGVSDGITIIVNEDPAVFDSADDTEICEGGTTTLQSEVIGGAGGNTYQWQELIEGLWVDIFGAVQADYTTDVLSTGSYTYRVVVTQDAGCQGVSDGETIVVTPDLLVTTQPSNVNECIGGTNTMTVVVSGGSGAITYQWQSSASSGGPWSNASGTGSTTSIFTPQSTVTGTAYYRVLINAANNGCDQAVSNNAIAIISPDLLVTSQPSNVNECIGGTNTMTVVVSGGSGAITVSMAIFSFKWRAMVKCIRNRFHYINFYPTKHNSWNDILQGIGECSK